MFGESSNQHRRTIDGHSQLKVWEFLFSHRCVANLLETNTYR